MKYKIPIVTLLLCVVIIGYKSFDYKTKKSTGYCFAEKKQFSNKDITDTAVNELLKTLKNEYRDMSIRQQKNTIVYADLNAFYEHQPDCCGFSTKAGVNAKPPPPRKRNDRDYFTKHIQYQHDLNSEKPWREVRVSIHVCNIHATVFPEYENSIKLLSGRPISRQ